MTVEDVQYSFERELVDRPVRWWRAYLDVLFPAARCLATVTEATAEQIHGAVAIVNGDSIQFNFVRPYPARPSCRSCAALGAQSSTSNGA